MTFVLIVALVAVVIAHVWLLDRKDKRAHAEREDFRRDMQLMATRIQAPDQALAEVALGAQERSFGVAEAETPEFDSEVKALWPA